MPKVTFLGHSCFVVEKVGTRILIDPFLSGNPQAAVGPEDVQCDYIVVTHAHGDHFGDAIDIARRTGATIISNFEIASYCAEREAKAHAMSLGGAYTFPFGTVKLTIAHHASSFPDGTYGGNPAGVTIGIDGKKIHHTGDTALHHDMKFVGEEGIDLAMVSIGDNFTMGVEDAIRALDFLRPRMVIPMHFNTFDTIQVDPSRFREGAMAKDVQCHVLEPGNSVEVK